MPDDVLSIETEAECNDIGGEWHEDFGVCVETEGDGEQFGMLAPIDGVTINYHASEYDPYGESQYIPQITMTTMDGAILHQEEASLNEYDTEDAAMKDAKKGALALGRDVRRAGVGSSPRGDVKKYEVEGHEVLAKSREQARESVEYVASRRRSRDQSRFDSFA